MSAGTSGCHAKGQAHASGCTRHGLITRQPRMGGEVNGDDELEALGALAGMAEAARWAGEGLRGGTTFSDHRHTGIFW